MFYTLYLLFPCILNNLPHRNTTVKVNLKTKGNSQIIYHTETIFLTNKQEDYTIYLPNPVKKEEVYPEFEFPPYASKQCFIESLTLTANKGNTGLLDAKVEDYSVENIGNAFLIRQMNSNKNFQIELFDSTGGYLTKFTDLRGQTILPVQNAGIYIVRISEDFQTKKIQKLLL